MNLRGGLDGRKLNQVDITGPRTSRIDVAAALDLFGDWIAAINAGRPHDGLTAQRALRQLGVSVVRTGPPRGAA